MNRNLTTLTALAALLTVACGPGRSITNDGGADGGATACTSNAQCDDNTPCTRDLCLVGGVCEHTADNSMCSAGQMCVSGRGCTSGGTRTCTSAAECDDRIACTRDSCLVEGVCRNQPDDTQCTGGQVCNPASGCGASTNCTTNAQCNDNVECTEDTCTVSGACEHVPQNSRCTGGRTCNTTMGCIMATACRNNAECDDGNYCNGAETCNTELACVAGTAVACADSDPCTIDACNESMRACTHTMDMACMGGTVRSGVYDVAMPVMYRCTDTIIGNTAIDLGVESFQFTVIGSNVTIVGRNTSGGTRFGTPSMMGTVMGMTFSATGVRSGDCPETYTLVGRFTDADHFTGLLSLSLSGATCSLTNCTNQMWNVMGTYHP